MPIDLTDDERQAMIDLLTVELQSTRFPLSPRKNPAARAGPESRNVLWSNLVLFDVPVRVDDKRHWLVALHRLCGDTLRCGTDLRHLSVTLAF